MGSRILRHTVILLLPFTLIAAACGGCITTRLSPVASSSESSPAPSGVQGYAQTSPHHPLSIHDELVFDDQSFDAFLENMLKHDEALSPPDQEQARVIRMGIILGTMMYLFAKQDIEVQAKIMDLAKLHHQATSDWYAKRRRELGLPPESLDGTETSTSTPPIPPAHPMHEHPSIVPPQHSLSL